MVKGSCALRGSLLAAMAFATIDTTILDASLVFASLEQGRHIYLCKPCFLRADRFIGDK